MRKKVSFIFSLSVLLALCFSTVSSAGAGDRPQPWLDEIPAAFKSTFSFGVKKKAILINEFSEQDKLADISEKENDERPEPKLPDGVFVLNTRIRAFSLKKNQVGWSAAVSPWVCAKESTCLSFLDGQALNEGRNSQTYHSYVINEKDPELNSVSQCLIEHKIDQKRESIELIHCHHFSKKSCSEWQDVISKSSYYEDLKIKHYPNGYDYNDFQDKYLSLKSKMLNIFKLPEDIGVKRDLKAHMMGLDKIKWEPDFIQKSNDKYSISLEEMKRVFKMESECEKYRRFFMSDAHRAQYDEYEKQKAPKSFSKKTTVH